MHNERVPKHKNLCWFFGFFSVPGEHVTWYKEPVGFTKREPAVFSFFHVIPIGYPVGTHRLSWDFLLERIVELL